MFDALQATNSKQIYICQPKPLVLRVGSRKYKINTPNIDNQMCNIESKIKLFLLLNLKYIM